MLKSTLLLVKNQTFNKARNLDLENLDGFHFKPMNRIGYDGVKVKKMVMINSKFVEKVLKRKIQKRLELYLRFIISIIDSDDNDTDITDLRAALNDLTRYKEIVKHKYQHYLDEKYAKLLLQKIELLEQELKNKIIYYQEPEEKEMEEHKRRR